MSTRREIRYKYGIRGPNRGDACARRAVPIARLCKKKEKFYCERIGNVMRLQEVVMDTGRGRMRWYTSQANELWRHCVL